MTEEFSAGIPIYGLTGGVASGKSTVGRMFQELGVHVIDADQIARDLRAPGGAAEPSILKAFGTTDPKLLRARISANEADRRTLEGILHPMIAEISRKLFSELASHTPPPPYALYEAALLIEAGRAADFKGVILVEAHPDLQVNRMITRDVTDLESARQFLGTQSSTAKKREVATHRIVNEGSFDELREKVRALHAALLRGEKSFSA
jgi:dephospho-CoA kinase